MNRQLHSLFLLFFFIGFLPAVGLAQNIVVTGQVKSNDDNLPLPGVTISLKNSGGAGSVTDVHGNFKINAPVNSLLSFSFIGYLSQEAIVRDEKPLIITLQTNVKSLNDVVVTGLASSIKRSNLANAVTSISGKELTGTTPPQTVDKGLYGKMPGANIGLIAVPRAAAFPYSSGG